MLTDPKDMIMKAKIQLLLDEPFFGTLLTRLKLIEDTDGSVTKTMATNGEELWWCAEYVKPLSPKKLQGLLAHEVMHIANGHMFRLGGRDHKQWNYACDAAIDHILADAGFDVPDSFTKNPQWNFAKGLAAEVIYDMMPKPPPQPKGNQGNQGSQPGPKDKSGRPGGVLPSPHKSPAQVAQAQNELKMALKQAALAQQNKDRKKGRDPAWLKAFVDSICDPKVPWEEHLRQFFSGQVPNGTTWTPPNRRFVYQSVYLPGQLKQGIGEGVIFFDSSGSCIQDWPQFCGEVNHILEELRPERVHLVMCDAAVGKFHTYEEGEPLDANVVGGGGSDFRPAFAEVAKRDVHPAWAVVLSDMIIDFPVDPPGYPVLAVSTTDKEGPTWAQNIKMHP